MRNNIIKVISFLAVAFTVSSCLKDDIGEDWTADLQGKMYAEVWNPGYASLGLQPVPDPVIFKFLVNIATDQLPTQDVTLTMSVNPDALTKYNSLKGTNYKLYPYIEILDKTVTIEAGTRNAYVHVKVWNANTLNACDNYMAPISITQATAGVVVSDPLNSGSRLMALPISNPYAGIYACTGYRIRPGNPTEPIVADEEFFTQDCKTVYKVGFGNYSSYNIRIEVTTNTMVVGGTTCYKVKAMPYDPGTGSDVGGQFDTWTGDPATPPPPPTNPTEINYYNPTAKKFVLNCWYTSSAGNRIMYEVHTRK
jgi:hypothetical protein